MPSKRALELMDDLRLHESAWLEWIDARPGDKAERVRMAGFRDLAGTMQLEVVVVEVNASAGFAFGVPPSGGAPVGGIHGRLKPGLRTKELGHVGQLWIAHQSEFAIPRTVEELPR